jgi:hypothetical protein
MPAFTVAVILTIAKEEAFYVRVGRRLSTSEVLACMTY